MAEYSNQVLGEEAALAQAMLMRDLVRARMTKRIAIASPAAGSEWSVSVPGGVIWELLWVKARLITSAVVATRIPEIDIKDADGISWTKFPPQATQVASQSIYQQFGKGYGVNTNSGGIAATSIPLDVFMLPGDTLQTVTFNLDIGDAWNSINVTVCEWSEWNIAYNVQYVAEQIAAVQR